MRWIVVVLNTLAACAAVDARAVATLRMHHERARSLATRDDDQPRVAAPATRLEAVPFLLPNDPRVPIDLPPMQSP